MVKLTKNPFKTRWWQLKYFSFSPRSLGKIPIFTSKNIIHFKRGSGIHFSPIRMKHRIKSCHIIKSLKVSSSISSPDECHVSSTSCWQLKYFLESSSLYPWGNGIQFEELVHIFQMGGFKKPPPTYHRENAGSPWDGGPRSPSWE